MTSMPPCRSRSNPCLPLAAWTTLKPSRVRPRSTSRASASSSSIYSSVGIAAVMWRSRGGLWDLNEGKEQSELANGGGEAFVFHRLGDVDVAAEFIAALDFLGIVGGGENHDRRA